MKRLSRKELEQPYQNFYRLLIATAQPKSPNRRKCNHKCLLCVFECRIMQANRFHLLDILDAAVSMKSIYYWTLLFNIFPLQKLFPFPFLIYPCSFFPPLFIPNFSYLSVFLIPSSFSFNSHTILKQSLVYIAFQIISYDLKCS